MSNSKLSILVVDDTKLSSAVVKRTLANSIYKDVRFASNAMDAFAQLEKQHADILISDWVMPKMDGLDLADKVRQLDEAENHATFIILLTAKEGPDAIKQAFDRGVDDFINKSTLNDQLLPRIYAADRIISKQNRLLMDNQRLLEANQKLSSVSTLDPVTGLGNDLYALKQLSKTIEYCESRKGATCYLLMELYPFEEMQTKYPQKIINQLMIGISRRLQQLVRPLDTLAKISDNEFALITHLDTLRDCEAKTFRRIYDDLNCKSFKTSMGYISIKMAMSISAADGQYGPMPKAETLMDLAWAQLPKSKEANLLLAHPWHPTKEAT